MRVCVCVWVCVCVCVCVGVVVRVGVGELMPLILLDFTLLCVLTLSLVKV